MILYDILYCGDVSGLCDILVECHRWELVEWMWFHFPIVVHEFIFNVLRLALEVVPVVQQPSRAQEDRGLRVASANANSGSSQSVGSVAWPQQRSARRSQSTLLADPVTASGHRGSFCLRREFASAKQASGASVPQNCAGLYSSTTVSVCACDFFWTSATGVCDN